MTTLIPPSSDGWSSQDYYKTLSTISWCFSHFSTVVIEWICSCTRGARSACKQGTLETFISTFNQFILLFSFIHEQLWNGKKYLQETRVKARTYPNKEK